METGKDKGSTFSWIRCEKCEETLGKVYITTSRALDDIRYMDNLFCVVGVIYLKFSIGTTLHC